MSQRSRTRFLYCPVSIIYCMKGQTGTVSVQYFLPTKQELHYQFEQIAGFDCLFTGSFGNGNDAFGNHSDCAETASQISLEHFCSRHKSFPVVGKIYLHQDSRFEWPELDESRTKSTAGSCRALDTHVAILHDGRVVACCLDYSGQITLGNIVDQSLAEILDSPTAKSLRDGFEKHELRHPLCQSCSFCKRFGK